MNEKQMKSRILDGLLELCSAGRISVSEIREIENYLTRDLAEALGALRMLYDFRIPPLSHDEEAALQVVMEEAARVLKKNGA